MRKIILTLLFFVVILLLSGCDLGVTTPKMLYPVASSYTGTITCPYDSTDPADTTPMQLRQFAEDAQGNISGTLTIPPLTAIVKGTITSDGTLTFSGNVGLNGYNIFQGDLRSDDKIMRGTTSHQFSNCIWKMKPDTIPPFPAT